MRQFLFIITISVFFISCKKKQPVTIISQKDKIETNIDLNSIKKLSCEGVFLELIKSSDFPFEKSTNHKKLSIIIDESDQNKIIGKLTFKTDGTGTLGWVNLNLKERKLYNESAHLEKPVQLSYNKEIFNILLKNCNIIPTKKNSNKNSQQKNRLIQSSNRLSINKLPFLFESYYKNNFPEKTYPNYTPSNILKEYLVTKDYDGENFDCYLLPPIHNLGVLLVSILRGDSSYFLILTYNSNKIIDMAEIGSMGSEDNIITFDINKKYIIKKYRGFKTNKVLIEKLKIDDLGKIIKL